MLERLQAALRKLPLTAIAATALITLAVAVPLTAVIASSGPQQRADDLANANASLRDQLDEATATAASTKVDLLTAERHAKRLQAQLRLTSYKRQRDQIVSQIADLEGQVSDQEAKLHTVKVEVAKSSISDGTWQLNVDYLPGTYQAAGGDGCYWAKLSGPSGDGIDGIIENGGFNSHPVVSVDSPYFETRDCGTWRRVG